MPWRRADRVADDAEEASGGWTDVAAGLDVYRRACEKHPRDGDLWFTYANALAALGRWGEAETVARNGLEAVGFDQDIWVLLLDSLVEQRLPDLLLRELETPFAASAHPLIAPVYRARALELRGGDPEALMRSLSDAYDEYGDVVRFDKAPRQTVLDLAQMLARHGARDEADYCLETLSRSMLQDDDVSWLAAATGVALWQATDEAAAEMYRERLLAIDDADEDEIEEAVGDAAIAITPGGGSQERPASDQ